MNSISSSLIQTLTQQPMWLSLSWEVRGMALHLMAMGDEDQRGTLAPEDDFWRNCLNIPSRHIVQQGLQQSISARGTKMVHETDLVWKEVWKPQLLRWFVYIDDHFLQTRPQYQNQKGRYWHPLLDWGQDVAPKPKKSKKTKDLSLSSETKDLPSETKTQVKTQAKSRAKAGAFKDPVWDYPTIRFSEPVIKRCWEVPLAQEARVALWEDAVGLLTGSGDNEQGARQFLGKMIKEYGEQKVAKAVAGLMVRPVKPADCKAFLRKQLKSDTEGSVAVQKAREQRVKVPL